MATKSITANGTTSLGDSGVGRKTTKVIHGEATAFTGNIAVQARKRGSSLNFTPIPYKRRNLVGAASDDTIVSAALTGTFIIEVNSSGLEIALVTTGYAAGSVAVETDDLIDG